MGEAGRLFDARRRSRPFETQCDGWLDSRRPPVRRDRWTDPDDTGQRARSPWWRVRDADGLRGWGHGPRDGDRGGGMIESDAAAPAGRALSTERRGAVTILRIDVPGAAVNVLGPSLVTEFGSVFEEIELDRELRGVVIAS